LGSPVISGKKDEGDKIMQVEGLHIPVGTQVDILLF
jgi:hypothetical protein